MKNVKTVFGVWRVDERFLTEKSVVVDSLGTDPPERLCSHGSLESQSWDRIRAPQDLEACYYFLGLVLADGSLHSRDTNQVTLALKEADSEVIKALAERFYSKTGLYKAGPKVSIVKGKVCRATPRLVYIACSWLLKQFVVEHGIETNKTGREKYKGIPDDMFWHFFRGFFDGDGSGDGDGLVLCGCRSLLESFNSDVLRLAGVEGKFRKHKQCDCLWFLEFRQEATFELYKRMYLDASLFIDRKRLLIFKKKSFFVELTSPEGKKSYWRSFTEAGKFSGVDGIYLAYGERHKTVCKGWVVRKVSHESLLQLLRKSQEAS